jgi:hypothetical protein
VASMDAARFLRRQAWIVPRNAFECNHTVSPSLNRVGRASTTRSGRRGVVDVMPLRRPHLAGLVSAATGLCHPFGFVPPMNSPRMPIENGPGLWQLGRGRQLPAGLGGDTAGSHG